MAEKLLILGESGQGKSTSLRNCDPSVTAIVSPVGKRLPFKGSNKFEMLMGDVDTNHILKFIREQVLKGKKLIVLDDFQYIMSVPYMHRIQENGWDKYNDFGKNYFDLIDVCNSLPNDVLVVYMSHTETLDDGITRIKLIGKLLREKITIEGLFETVLKAKKVDDNYYFITQSDGKDTIKSPMGMFSDYSIENDLNFVYEAIKNYYEFGEYKSDEEIKTMSEEVVGDLEKPEPRAKKQRPRREPKSDIDSIAKKVEQENKENEALTLVADKHEDDPFNENIEEPKVEEQPKRRQRRVRQ